MILTELCCVFWISYYPQLRGKMFSIEYIGIFCDLSVNKTIKAAIEIGNTTPMSYLIKIGVYDSMFFGEMNITIFGA